MRRCEVRGAKVRTMLSFGRVWSSDRASLAVLIALAAAFLCMDTPHAQAPKRLALVGGMLVTGYDVPPIHHAAILIEGDRIVAAGPSSDVRIPPTPVSSTQAGGR